MKEIRLKFDDNSDLVKSMEKRTALLEKLLAQSRKEKGKEVKVAVKMINDSKANEAKTFTKLAGNISSAISKIGSQKINIVQKDNSSILVSAMNKRINLLESLLKKTKPQKTVVKVVEKTNSDMASVERKMNVLLDAFNKRSYSQGISVIPSPS